MRRLLLAPLLLATLAGQFRDVTAESGIAFLNQPSKTTRKYLLESMTGGVAMLDYDGDGRLDLYFVNGAKLEDPMPAGAVADKSDPRFWNRLYRNLGDGRWLDVTAKAGVAGLGYGMGAAAADFDNDGDTDLYLTNYGANILYRNNGNGTFTDVTAATGVAASGWSVSAAFLDYDRDGWLDLFVSRYVEWDFSRDIWCGERKPGLRAYCHPDQFPATTHQLFRNGGDGRFRDVSKASGIAAHPGKGLGVAVADIDRDGWPDLVVANDHQPQQLFRNRQNGTFAEEAAERGIAFDEDGKTFAGMGVDAADFDQDGWPDIVINALANERYALFRNQQGQFDYATQASGLGRASLLHSGWGMKLADFDNDGWRDLLVAQGHVMDNIERTQPQLRYREPILLLGNQRGRFVERDGGQDLARSRAARGAAFGDVDNDGAIDFAVNSNAEPAAVFRNRTGGHWLTVSLRGTRSNRDGIGAAVAVTLPDGAKRYGYSSAASSYASSNDRRVHFGLGEAPRVTEMAIVWPSGVTQTLRDVAVNRVLVVEEPR